MKENLIKQINNIDITYDYEGSYGDLYQVTMDYMNKTQDFSLEYLFEDFIDYDCAEEIGKRELEKGGLLRLKCFLGNVTLTNDLFRIDGYGNLENVTKEDLEYLKEQILEVLNNERA